MNYLQGPALLVGYLWLGTFATLRHVWLATTLRPDWEYLADSGPSFAWFGAFAFLAGVLRWHIVGDQPLLSVSGHVLIWMSMVMFVIERRERSSACVFMCWAAAGGIDLLASFLAVVGLPVNEADSELRTALLAAELGLDAVIFVSFRSLPANMQKTGYGRRRPANVPPPPCDAAASSSKALDADDRSGGPQP